MTNQELSEEELQEALVDLKTIGDFLRWCTSKFLESDIYFGHGATTALDESATLISYSLNLPFYLDDAIKKTRLVKSEKKKLLALISTRVNKKIPLAYMTNSAWFLNREFFVDQRVIIPRSPIAELIENRFAPYLDFEPKTALDMCTGSACLAISLAFVYQKAVVDASDISLEALQVGQINIEHYQLEERVFLIESNLFDDLPKTKYDLIVANPPYVSLDEFEQLPKEYSYEPKLALVAKNKGLALALEIIKNSYKFLTDKGILVLEIGKTKDAFVAMFPKMKFLWHEFSSKMAGADGVLVMKKKEVKAMLRLLD